ncbi:MAG: MFS transporter [Anaerolineae bacterium]|nr:MFS transporter [Anaerolineae bacterium]
MMNRFQNKINSYLGLSLRIFSIIFLSRLLRDTGARMIFPFIPQISAGLGLTVVAFSWLIFIQSMAGLVGPVFGVLSDRYGRRKIMGMGLLLQGTGATGLAVAWQGGAALPMLVLGLGLAVFIPAQQAYVSDQVLYQRRGRTLGTIEYSWALVAIFVLPLVGWLIDTLGWRTPFLIIGPLTVAGALLIWFGLPRTERHTQTTLSWSAIRTVLFRPNVMGAVMMALLIYIALSSFLSLWGIWLATDFGLDAVAIGLVATAIGITELGGSVSSSLFIDRFGKKRGGGLGLLLAAIVFATLPFTQGQLFCAIGGLVVLGLLMEFTIVSLIPLYSEQVPEARGTVLSLLLFGSSIGLAIGPPITANLWAQFGLRAVCVVAATCLGVAFIIMRQFLLEYEAGQ